MSDIRETLLGIGFPADITSKLVETGKTIPQIKRLSKDQQLRFGITPELKEKLDRRKPIPEKIVSQLLYESKRTCCICNGTHSNEIVIHHITSWGETKDNSENNLVVLCLHCHGEAHTVRGLSRNLTKDQILHAKKEWLDLVKKTAEDRATGIARIQTLNYWTYWDYFNIRRIYSLIQGLGINLDLAVQSDAGKQLYLGGYITTNGSLDFSQWPDDIKSKGYWLAFYEGMWISQYLVHLIDCLFKNINLKTIDPHQSTREIISNTVIGDFVLIQDAFYFKRLTKDDCGHDQNKRVYLHKKTLEIGGIIDSWYCITMSAKMRLMGKNRSSVIGIVTNIDQNGTKLSIELSILAIGQFLDPAVIKFYNPLNNQ